MSSTEVMRLDPENEEFFKAVEIIKSTNKNLFLTGKAGAGKTTFLKHVKEHINNEAIIVAPTGVAAINAGGTTLFSFFQIPFSPFTPNDSRLSTSNNVANNIYETFQYKQNKRELLNNMSLLIIDEVSMVRVDLIDVIDRLLRVFRRNPHLPFGGVQVLFIGDPFQLAPIARNDEWAILSQYYESPFFFDSNAFIQNPPFSLELKKIYRQKDSKFKAILNSIRTNEITDEQLDTLNLQTKVDINQVIENEIALKTHTDQANYENAAKLDLLNSRLVQYEATVEGQFKEKNHPTNFNLNLKVGAQVMTLKNKAGYYNGKIGVVSKLLEDKILVDFEDVEGVEITRHTWEDKSYTFNSNTNSIEETVNGSFTQFPLKLAWAITIHKSQGLTFEKVKADLSHAFAAGQVYVALSRCTSLEGLRLENEINREQIITDSRAISFAERETPLTLINEELNDCKASNLYKLAYSNALKGYFSKAFEDAKEAIELRNDLNSPDFHRAIKIIESKRAFILGLFVQGYKVKKENNKTLIHEMHELKKEKSKLHSKVSYRDKKIKNLEAKLQSYQISNEAKESKIKSINQKLRILEEESNKQEKEIIRLNKLSWLDKLLNKN